MAEGPGFGSAADAPQRPGGARAVARRQLRHALAERPVELRRATPAVDCWSSGLSIIKPPYAVISAVNVNKGDIKWQVPYGETPDAVRNHPALKGMLRSATPVSRAALV